ncbi:MAG: LON peptidase substrate-binding domain-containing protein [Thermomicrobiales bacterium]
MAATPESMPLFPLSGVLFPGAILPLHIFEPRYLTMLADLEAFPPDDRRIGVVLTKVGSEVGDRPTIHDHGTSAAVIVRRGLPDGRELIVLLGQRRFAVAGSSWDGPYLVGQVRMLDDEEVDPGAAAPLVTKVRAAFSAYLGVVASIMGSPVDLDLDAMPDDPAGLGYWIASRVSANPWESQAMLEAVTPADRLDIVLRFLRRERALLAEQGASGIALEHPGRRFSAN